MLDAFTQQWFLSRFEESTLLTSWLNFAWIFVFMVATQVAMTFARFVHRQFMPTLTLGRFFGAQEVPDVGWLFQPLPDRQVDYQGDFDDSLNGWAFFAGFGEAQLPSGEYPEGYEPPTRFAHFDSREAVEGDVIWHPANLDQYGREIPRDPSTYEEGEFERPFAGSEGRTHGGYPYSGAPEDAPVLAVAEPEPELESVPAAASSHYSAGTSEAEMEHEYRRQKNGW